MKKYNVLVMDRETGYAVNEPTVAVIEDGNTVKEIALSDITATEDTEEKWDAVTEWFRKEFPDAEGFEVG